MKLIMILNALLLISCVAIKKMDIPNGEYSSQSCDLKIFVEDDYAEFHGKPNPNLERINKTRCGMTASIDGDIHFVGSSNSGLYLSQVMSFDWRIKDGVLVRTDRDGGAVDYFKKGQPYGE